MNTSETVFSGDVLTINPAVTASAIENAIRQQVRLARRRGVVVGLSGGSTARWLRRCVPARSDQTVCWCC